MDTGVVVCTAFDYKQDGLQDAGSTSDVVNALAVDSAQRESDLPDFFSVCPLLPQKALRVC